MAREQPATRGDIRSPANVPIPLAFSIGFWFYPTSAASTALSEFQLSWGTLADPIVLFHWSFASQPTLIKSWCFLNDLGQILAAFQYAEAMPPQNWYHLLLSYDNLNVRTYLDGVPSVSTTFAGPIETAATQLVALYTTFASGKGQGRMCELDIWDRVLTPAEVASRAAQTDPRFIHATDLQLAWPVYGVDDPEPDISGNGRTGTVSTPVFATHIPQVQRSRFGLSGYMERPYGDLTTKDPGGITLGRLTWIPTFRPRRR